MLDHIHIENFRLFKMLDIPKVGQVNLITGKNNAGKTTLLEALRLWGNRTSAVNIYSTIDLLLRSRDQENGTTEDAYKSLFLDYNANLPIQINDLIKIEFEKKTPPALLLESPGGNMGKYTNQITNEPTNDVSFYIPASFDLTNARLWKNMVLNPAKKEKTLDILRIIEPKLSDLFVDTGTNSAIVSLGNSPQTFPLRTFGEGMNRLLSIALGLVSAENNMLLIDEIDLGLHHSVQHTLWEIVFQKARDLNVQVFATTHSSDCVEAFSDIANKLEYNGMGNYIRLQRSKKDGNIMAVDYEMEQLERSLEFNSETR